MKIVISGLGVMGASLALAIKNSKENIKIWGFDNHQTLSQAMDSGLIDNVITNWPADCVDADIVFLATPIKVIKQHLSDLNGIVSDKTIVTDIGSTKSDLKKFCVGIKFSGLYIGGHPMTGAEKSGISAANPLMYENAIYILTELKENLNHKVSAKLIPLLQAIKARVFFLDTETHDKIMALISHLPQMIAVSLVNLVGKENSQFHHCFELAAGGFRDLTRIASSSSGIWQDIIDSNKHNINLALNSFISQLESEKRSLNSIAESFESASDFRNHIPNTTKGFLSPLTKVLVYVNDQQGAIAKISTSLFEQNIDIRDIELLKIREHEGGVFMLSFENPEKANKAIKILKSIGYKAFVKE